MIIDQIRKVVVFFISLTFVIYGGKSMAQLAPVQPSKNSDSIVPIPNSNRTARDQMPDPDTLRTGLHPSKLTAAQLKKIVGDDKPIGKDTLGREFYQDVHSKKYFVNSKGVKIYINNY